mgnify:CR=1 FL=1
MLNVQQTTNQGEVKCISRKEVKQAKEQSTLAVG